MAAAMENQELIDESIEQERELNFLPGEDVDALVQRLTDAPDEYRELLSSLY
jgi:hypothetical protein